MTDIVTLYYAHPLWFLGNDLDEIDRIVRDGFRDMDYANPDRTGVLLWDWWPDEEDGCHRRL